MIKNAQLLATPGKGILASDESNSTCGKRLEGNGIDNSEAMRQTYRQLLYTTKGIENHISGVIMYDETARQSVIVDGKKTDTFINYL